MHVAKRTRLVAGLVAALGIAVCAGGWSGAAVADKFSAKPVVAASGENVTVLANDILNRWEPVAHAAGAHSAAWRDIMGTQLGMMSVDTLKRLSNMSADGNSKAAYKRFNEAFAGAIMQLYASGADAKVTTKDLGSSSIDQVFIPVTPPCRIVDSRNAGGGGMIAFNTTRYYYFYANAASGGWSWSSQGGDPGLATTVCPRTTLAGTLGNTVPSAAVATVTVVSPTAAGNFDIWSGVGAAPGSSALNWAAGQTLANTTVIPTGNRVAPARDFAVRYNGPSGAAHVVVDVVGYFVRNGATALSCVYLYNAASTSVPANSDACADPPACTAGYTQTGALFDNVSFGGLVMSQLNANVAGGTAMCARNTSGTAKSFTAGSICCRVPGQ
jgi:hypothetical protein